MSHMIYLADDDAALTTVFSAFLEGAGFEVRTFPTGDELAFEFALHPADLVVLDVMMPGTDGLTICGGLRAISDVPIIILTAKDSELDYMRGLEMGGDDYLTKPFAPAKLVSRIRALLRRVEMDKAKAPAGGELSFADVTLSEAAHKAEARGRELALTMTEFALLRCLLERAGDAVSRDDLLAEVWGTDVGLESRVTDEAVHRLRRKLRSADSRTRIKAVWGFGYRLVDPDAQP